MTEEELSARPFPQVQYTHEEPQTPQPVRLAASITVILLITIASFWLALNPQWVMSFGNWGYVGAFVISLIASATIILPAPGIAVVIAMGTALDPVLLGIVAGMGSAIGELSGYLAGTSGRALIPSSRRTQFEQIHRLTDRYGAALLFGLSAIPFPLFDFAGIIAGMLKIRIATFLATVAAGKSIKYVLMILLGAGPLLYLQELFNIISSGH
ncbi:MAG: VTT domain-containing protein [Caldilineaceae bacterium]|nr:VTT domain-containing protein [Caldilineaceae bacterium]